VPDLYRGKVALEASEARHLMTGLNLGDAAGQDVRGAVQHLKATGSAKAGVTGFCMGGALTVLSAVNVPETHAAVVWYGFPPLEYVDATKIKAPMLGHYATEDEAFPIATVDELEQKLRALICRCVSIRTPSRQRRRLPPPKAGCRLASTDTSFRSTARCASRPPTAPDASGCCATRARPPFALDRLRQLAPEHLVHDHPKPGPGAGGALLLTPLRCPIRRSRPPSSSTSASPGNHHRRRSSVRDAGLARAGGRQARAAGTPADADHPHPGQQRPRGDPRPPSPRQTGRINP
jgi:hypothetical protein